jgi:hypothetical protein
MFSPMPACLQRLFPRTWTFLFSRMRTKDHLDGQDVASFSQRHPAALQIRDYKTARFPGEAGIHQYPGVGVGPKIGSGRRSQSHPRLTTAEYINDSALFVEHECCRLLNETDCKQDLERSGANRGRHRFLHILGCELVPDALQLPARRSA